MRNTVEIVVTCFDEASSGSLSPCGRGPGRGGQGSTNRLVRGRGQASSPLSLPSPARGEGQLKTGRPLGYSYFNGIDLKSPQNRCLGTMPGDVIRQMYPSPLSRSRTSCSS